MASTKLKKVNKRTAGFTLVEVLVALAIIAISMSAALSTSGSQASSAAYLKQKTIANWVALNEMTQFQLAKSITETGKVDGDAKMAGITWYWTRKITPLVDVKNVFEIQYKVYNDKKRKSALITLASYGSNASATTSTNTSNSNINNNGNNSGNGGKY
jgi:general secretion pathway protein I